MLETNPETMPQAETDIASESSVQMCYLEVKILFLRQLKRVGLICLLGCSAHKTFLLSGA